MTRRWRSLGTSSPDEAAAGAIAGARAARSGPGPASSSRTPATAAQARTRRSLDEVGARSQAGIGCYTPLKGPSSGPIRLKQAMGARARYQVPASRPAGDSRMRPLGFLTGVVLGSAASIALVLLMVVVVFALAAGGPSAIRDEYPGLLATAGLFGVLAGAAGCRLCRAAAGATVALGGAGPDVAAAGGDCLVLLACGRTARGMT